MPACQRGWHLQGQWLAPSVGGRLSVWAVSHHLVFVLCECFLPAPWGRSPVTHWGPLGVLGHSGGQNLLLGVRKGRLCGQGQPAGPSRCTLPPTWAATPGSRQTTHTRAHPRICTYAHARTRTHTRVRTHTAAHLEADKPHAHARAHTHTQAATPGSGQTTHTHARVHTHTHARTHTCMQHTHMHTRTHGHTHTWEATHARTRAHTCTHAHSRHTWKWLPPQTHTHGQPHLEVDKPHTCTRTRTRMHAHSGTPGSSQATHTHVHTRTRAHGGTPGSGRPRTCCSAWRWVRSRTGP